MRWQITILVLAVVGIMGLDMAPAQSPIQQIFASLGIVFGKDNHPDPITLMRKPEVRKEIGLADADSLKVDVALWKALKEALDDNQFRRLKQIDLQQRGYKAFGDPIVQGELKLNDTQKADVVTIVTDADEQIEQQVQTIQQSWLSGGAGAGAGIERIKALAKDTKERCTDVLSAEQRRLWQEMVGEEFKLPPPPFEIPGLKTLDTKGFDKNAKKGKGKG